MPISSVVDTPSKKASNGVRACLNHLANAGISTVLLSLKPPLAVLLVPFMIHRWLRNRNGKSLALFSRMMVVPYLPALLLNSCGRPR